MGMAQYELEVGGRTVTVDAPDDASDSDIRQKALEQLLGPSVVPEPKRTLGGNAKEFLKGIPAGGIGALESAATGLSQLLPDQDEPAARKAIADTAASARAPFMPNPGYEDAMSSKLGQGIGSTLAFVPTAMIPGVGGIATTAALAGAMGAGEATQKAAAAGASESDISKAGALGILAGIPDALPVERALRGARVLRKALGPEADVVSNVIKEQAAKFAASRTGRIAETAAFEGGTEFAQAVAQNLIAKGIYDPTQGVFTNTGEDLGYGAGVGGLMQALLEIAIPGHAHAAHNVAPKATAEDVQTPPADTHGYSEADQAELARMQDEEDTAALEQMYAQEQQPATEAAPQPTAPAVDDNAELARMQAEEDKKAELERVQQTQAIDAQREQARQEQTTARRQAVLQPLLEADVPDVHAAFLDGLKQAGFGEHQLAVTPEEDRLIQRAADVKAAVAAEPAPTVEPTPVVPSSPNEMPVEALIPEKKPKPVGQPELPGVAPASTPKAPEGALYFQPAGLDALGIPPQAPVRKRIAKKDMNDPVQRAQVAEELRTFAALRTTPAEVSDKINRVLEHPEWTPAVEEPVAQGQMFGPKGGVLKQTKAVPKAVEPAVATAPEVTQEVSPAIAEQAKVEPSEEPVAKPEPAKTEPLPEAVNALSTQELADIHEMAKLEGSDPVALAKELKRRRKTEKVQEPGAADVSKKEEKVNTSKERVQETPKTEQVVAPVAKEEAKVPKVEEPAPVKKEQPKFTKPAPLNTSDEIDQATAAVEGKRADADAKADRSKLEALPEEHPAKKYFKKGEALQSGLSDLAVDVVHVKDTKTKEASAWVRKNLSAGTKKAYERRLQEVARDGRSLYNMLTGKGSVLSTPLPESVVSLLSTKGQTSAQDLLMELAKHVKGDSAKLIQALIPNIGKVTVTTAPTLTTNRGTPAAGRYDPSIRQVTLSTGENDNGLTVHTLMHELTHAATTHMLDNPSHPAARQLQKIYEEVKTLFPEQQAAKSVKEFVAEAFSNPEFRALMAQMKPIGEGGSLYQRFVEAVKQMFRGLMGTNTLSAQTESLIHQILSPAPDGLDSTVVYSAINDDAVPSLVNQLHQQLPGKYADDIEVARDWLADKAGKARAMALQILPLKAVADIIEKDIPAAQDLYKLLEQVNGSRSEAFHNVRQTGIDLREKLGNDPAVRQKFFDMAAEATLSEVNPAEPRTKYAGDTEKEAKWDELNKLYWKPLGKENPRAQQAYKDLINAYKKPYAGMLSAIDERVDNMDMSDASKSSMKKQLRQFMGKATVDPYIPLYRNGDYWLAFRHKDNMEPEVISFETVEERTRAKQALRSDPNASDVEEFASPAQFKDYAQRVPNTFSYRLMQSLGELETKAEAELKESLDKRNATPQERKDALASLHADHADVRERTLKMILDAMPESSFAQSFRKREGRLGFEKDALKVYDKRMASLMNQTVNMKYASQFAKMEDRIRAEAKAGGDQQRHADYKKLLQHYMDFARNPVLPKWNRIAQSLTFGMSLGFGVAPVMVNMSNLPVVAVPYLAAEHGLIPTAKAMGEALKTYTGTGFSRNESLLVPTVDKDGNVTETRKNGVAGWSLDNLDYESEALPDRTKRLKPLVDLLKERGALLRSNVSDILDLNNSTSTKWDKVNAIMGAMFHHGERLNRQVTAIAAYNLTLDKLAAAGKPIDETAKREAAEKALDTMERVNGNAGKTTAAKLAHGPISSLIYMYKSFGVSMMYNQFKMAKELVASTDPETQRIAKRQIAGLYASSALLAGVSGVPLYGIVSAIANLLFLNDPDDEDFDTLAAKFFGEGMYSGALNYLTGADWSSRIAMTNMIMRSQPNEPSGSLVMDTLQSLGGPVLGQASRLTSGAQLISEGEVWRGLERFTPGALANVMKATRYGTEGANTLRGDPITEDIGPGNVLMQALGFAPASYMEQMKKNAMNKRIDRDTTQQIDKLLRRRYLAVSQGDIDELQNVDREIADINIEHPGLVPPATQSRSLQQNQKQALMMRKYGGVYISPKMRPIIDAMNREWEE